MDASFLAKKYGDSVKNQKITAEAITKLPKLVTCGNWNKVEIVGAVDYMHDVPAVHYKGLILRYEGGLYYISQKAADELAKLDKRFMKGGVKIQVE